MDKSVLLSIKPKNCELIASGKKTIEIRKNRPKIDVPFKCYIYCTSSDIHSALVVNSLKTTLFRCCNYKTAVSSGGKIGNGKVIGEFVCDFIYHNVSYDCRQSCVSIFDLIEYARGKPLYAWHISGLVIYDKPKELSEFYSAHKYKNCHRGVQKYDCDYCFDCGLTCPPQSWCYVEEADNE